MKPSKVFNNVCSVQNNGIIYGIYIYIYIIMQFQYH